MPQIGEAVKVSMIDDEDWECPFEHKNPGNVTNDLDSSSKKLVTRLGNGTSTIRWEMDASGSIVEQEIKHKSLITQKTDAVPLPHEVDVELELYPSPPFS